MVNGSRSTVASDTYSTGTTVSVRVVASSDDLDVYVGGTHEIDTKDSSFTEGGVALGGDQPKFDNLKIGHDNNADGDLADAGDDLLVDEGFGSTSVTFTYDP